MQIPPATRTPYQQQTDAIRQAHQLLTIAAEVALSRDDEEDHRTFTKAAEDLAQAFKSHL